MAKAPALAGGFELPLEPRLPRVGSVDAVGARGPRRRAREALDQAGVEAVRARARGADDGPDDARGRGHAGQGRGAVLEGRAARSVRPERPVGARRVCVYPNLVPTAVERLRGTGVKVASVATAFPSGQAPLDASCRGALGRRAGRRRGRHGDRPRRVPLRPLREGLRRDRADQGGVRRRAPEGDPRGRRARHVRQRAPRVAPGHGRGRRLHQDVDRQAPRRRDAARDARACWRRSATCTTRRGAGWA